MEQNINVIRDRDKKYATQYVNALLRLRSTVAHLDSWQQALDPEVYTSRDWLKRLCEDVEQERPAVLEDKPVKELECLRTIESNLDNDKFVTELIITDELIVGAQTIDIILDTIASNNLQPIPEQPDRELSVAEEIIRDFLTEEQQCLTELRQLQQEQFKLVYQLSDSIPGRYLTAFCLDDDSNLARIVRNAADARLMLPNSIHRPRTAHLEEIDEILNRHIEYYTKYSEVETE